jgi:uncharacterized protein YidB (DUF937 family)
MAGNELGSLLGGILGSGGQGSAKAGNLVGALLSAVGGGQGGNPLGGLLDLLTQSGLAEQKNSWVGTGENQSVTGAQIRQAIPDETLNHVAEQAGLSPDVAATELAQVLPTAVDKLTPNGQVPASLDEIVKQQSE